MSPRFSVGLNGLSIYAAAVKCFISYFTAGDLSEPRMGPGRTLGVICLCGRRAARCQASHGSLAHVRVVVHHKAGVREGVSKHMNTGRPAIRSELAKPAGKET